MSNSAKLTAKPEVCQLLTLPSNHLQHSLPLLCFVLIVGFSQPLYAIGKTDLSRICDEAARLVANETGVPFNVLKAITRTETGRGKNGILVPWPWTVNMEGKGKWFDSEDEARSYVFKHFKRGARSFDVGCFQLNYRWHGTAFESIDEMFDPFENARYAASFLEELFAETGDWSKAAGAYHSRTPKHAKKYRARFDKIRLKLAEETTSVSATTSSHDQNRFSKPNLYPLLRKVTQTSTNGSLVPLTDTERSPLVSFHKNAEGF